MRRRFELEVRMNTSMGARLTRVTLAIPRIAERVADYPLDRSAHRKPLAQRRTVIRDAERPSFVLALDQLFRRASAQLPVSAGPIAIRPNDASGRKR